MKKNVSRETGLTVACVLKSGGDYSPEHVSQLAAGLRRWMEIPYRLVCLSDVPVYDCERIPLKHSWPGWWSKIELFRPGLIKTPALYLDLDTVIVSAVDKFVLGQRFTMLHSFSRPENPGSGVMAWNGEIDLAPIYRAFARAPKRWAAECVTHECWGDQGFIFRHTPLAPEYWQDKCPGKIVSYKKDCLPIGGRAPAGAAIVCYHGKPRPWHAPLV